VAKQKKKQKKSSNPMAWALAAFLIFLIGLPVAGEIAEWVKDESGQAISTPVTPPQIEQRDPRLGTVPYDDPVYAPVHRVVSWDPEVVPMGNWKDNQEFTVAAGKAFELIHSLKGHAELSTPTDDAIFEIVEVYRTGKKKPLVHYTPNDASSGGYKCHLDNVYELDRAKVSIPELAVTLYHEMTHKVQCDNIAKLLGIKDYAEMRTKRPNYRRCDIEEPGHASGLRMCAALESMGNLPMRIADLSPYRNLKQKIEGDSREISQGIFCPTMEQRLLQRADKLL